MSDKKLNKGWIYAVVALAAIGGGGAWWMKIRKLERTDDAQLEGSVVPVQARVSGFAKTVRVRDDQLVKEGDTLFTLDPTEILLKLRQTEAELWAAKAASQSGVAGAGAQAAKAQKAVAQNNVEAAKANLEKANQDLERTRRLRQKDVASQSQLDAAEAAARSAAAVYQAASEQAQVSGFGETGAQAQIRLTEAKIAAAQAAVDAARTQYSWTFALAPVSGRVAKRNLEQGQFVSAGQPLMAIVSDSAVWVVGNFKETQIDRIRQGQLADVVVDAFPGRRFEGRVRSLQAATGSRFSLLPPDNASGNFTKVVQRVPVRIDLSVPDSLRTSLLPGLSANVSIHVRD
jgi:membrane fusion protein (multidrug efflux system)